MGRTILSAALCAASLLAHAQQPTPILPPPSPVSAQQPLPDLRQLILDVEQNALRSQVQRKDYTYHVHFEEQELDSKGNLKKTAITDSESVTIEGARINRVVARNGKPLTPDETRKEDARIDKEVAKYKERHTTLANGTEVSTFRGDDLVTAAQILKLGTFSNPRRIDLDDRSTIVADYAGDPAAKSHNEFQGVFRDLVGTVWIDERDRVLVRGQGHFLKDFKVGGGLLLDIHKGLSFDFRSTKINNEVWLPASVDAQGSARILLFGKINGRIHLVTSDYKKFRTTTTIIQSDRVIGPDGLPVSPDKAEPAIPAASPAKPPQS